MDKSLSIIHLIVNTPLYKLIYYHYCYLLVIARYTFKHSNETLYLRTSISVSTLFAVFELMKIDFHKMITTGIIVSSCYEKP